MNSTKTHSRVRPVLLVGHDSGAQDFLQQALCRTQDHVSLEDGMGDQSHSLSVKPEPVLFSLVRTENWRAAYQAIEERKGTGDSFSLIFLTMSGEPWNSVRENIEKIWELDSAVHCVVCVPGEAVSQAARLQLSRPNQWALLRVPGEPEEVIQLASCLTALPSSEAPPPTQELDPQQAALASAQHELASSKVYVENVLRSMADSLLVIEANLTIGSVNPALLELLGYAEDDLIGQSPGLIFGEEFAQGSIIENLMLQGSVSGIESSFQTCDGRCIPISVSGSMIQDEQGQFQGLVCVAQDITERKRMEEEKLQLHQQLLDTSRQLGMAEVASDVLHNVGNVLNSIYVSIGVVRELVTRSIVGDVERISQLFQKHKDDLSNYLSTNPKGKQIPAYLEKLAGQLLEEQRAALAELTRLHDNAQQAQQCVAAQQDLAQPSRITEPLFIEELLEEALTANQDLLKTSQIDVVREFQEIPQLIVEKRQVLEVLVDLIRNACEAMSTSLVKRLVIRAILVPGPPDSVRLEIQDSGVGIAPEDLTKIFGQGNQTQHGGRGMSLHNGALVAKNLGGALRAHSQGKGQGATFSLELPGNFHFPEL